MRTILIAIGGGGVAAGSYALSRISDRSVGSIFVFVAFFATVLTIGLVIASGFAAWLDRPRQPRTFAEIPARKRLWTRGNGKERCGCCNRPMTRVGALWICPACDRVSV